VFGSLQTFRIEILAYYVQMEKPVKKGDKRKGPRGGREEAYLMEGMA